MSEDVNSPKPVLFSAMTELSLTLVSTHPGVYTATYASDPVYYSWPNPAAATWNKQFQLDLPAGTTLPSNAIVSIYALDTLKNAYPCSTPSAPVSVGSSSFTTYTAVSWPYGLTAWPSPLNFTIQAEFPMTETPPKD